MENHVRGKTFFITGGAQGLGKAYTQALLSHGARVFFGDINAAAGEATLVEMVEQHGGDRVKFKAFDVSDKGAYESAFNQAVSEFGHVDVLVNNAGIMNEGLWEKMIQVNVTGVVWGTKLATAHMRKDRGGRGGRIINVCSVAGLNDYFCLSIYCGTKHAVRSFTSALSQQPNIEAQGVEYSMICPAAVATDLVHKLDESKIDYYEMFIEQLKTEALEPQRVVDAFLHLVTLTNMNGAILEVDTDGAMRFKMMMQVEVSHPDGDKDK